MAILMSGWFAVVPLAVSQKAPAADAQAAARRGHDLYVQGDYAQALVEFDRALAGGVGDGHTLYRAAHCQQLTGKELSLVRQTMTRSIGALDKIINLGKGEATLIDYAYLSAAYAVIGDRNTARQTAASGIKAYREGRFGNLADLSIEDTYHLGRLAAETGDAGLQVEAYGRFIEGAQASPVSPPDQLGGALADIGAVHLAQGRFEEAREALARALELMPPSRLPGTRFALAVALFRLGRYKKSELEWERVRLEDPLREAQAGYARQAMQTLAQKDVLLDESNPLPNLLSFTQDDLEQRMLSIAVEMAQAAAGLPAEALRRGYLRRRAEPEDRAAMHRFRDLKVRLAYAAAEYVARGYQIREFAFANGLQGGLTAWHRLPNIDEAFIEGDIPTSIVGKDLVAEYEKRAARRAARREQRQATGDHTGTGKKNEGKKKPRADGKDSGESPGGNAGLSAFGDRN